MRTHIRTGIVVVIALAPLLGAPRAGRAQGTEPSDNIYTRSAALYLQRAQQNADPHERQQRFHEALDAAFKAIHLEAGNPKGYEQAGEAYVGLGDLVGADSMLTRAEQIYPGYRKETTGRIRLSQWVGQYNQGIGRLQQGDYDAAIEFFQRANTIYKERPVSMLNLAQAYSQTGKTDEAIDAYRKALAVIRSDLFARQSEERKAQWKQNEEVAAFNLAQLLAQSGHNEEAAQAYQDFLKDNPDNVTALSNLALVLNNMQMPDSALAIYNQLLARTDLSAQEYFNTGLGLFQAEDYQQAAEALARAAELNPGNRDAVYDLAQALFLSEQFDQLVPVAERLVEELDPYNPNAYKLYVQGLVQTGQEDEALQYQNKMDSLAFEITGTSLRPSGSGGGVITATLTNKKLEPGSTVNLTFTWVDQDGGELGTTQVQVEAPAQGETTDFQTELTADKVARGFSYAASPM